MYYILDENRNPVPEPDITKWADWFTKEEKTPWLKISERDIIKGKKDKDN